MSRRGGTRGGHDQFTWDQALGDKYRDNYLGQSLHSTQRPTFNNPNPNAGWWLGNSSSAAAPPSSSEASSGDYKKHKSKKDKKDKKDKRDKKDKMSEKDRGRQQRDELAAVKAQEERLMLQAMGIIPKDAPVGEPQNRLDKLELQKLLERKHEREEADDDGSRIAGLGFGDSKHHDAVKEILADKQREQYDDEDHRTKFTMVKEFSATSELPVPDRYKSERERSSRHDKDRESRHKKHKKHSSKRSRRSRSRSVSRSRSTSRDRYRDSRRRSRSPRYRSRSRSNSRERYDDTRKRKRDNSRERYRREASPPRGRLDTPPDSPPRGRLDTPSPPRGRLDTPSPKRSKAGESAAL